MLLFSSAKILVFISQVLKFQSTLHVLHLFTFIIIFCFVLVSIEYLIYFKMVPKKHLSISEEKEKKEKKCRANKISTMS